MILPLEWEPIPGAPPELYWQMESILARWEFTRYASGQAMCKVGADCIGFACSAMDELDGRGRAGGGTLPADVCLHDPKKARKAVAQIRRRYEPARRIRRRAVQPFDFVVVGPSGGGPGHLMLVGPRKNTLWHCAQGAGAQRGGWALGKGYEQLHAVYRLDDRKWW